MYRGTAGVDYPLYKHCSNPNAPLDFLDMAVSGTLGYPDSPPDDQNTVPFGHLIHVQSYTCGVAGTAYLQVTAPDSSQFSLGYLDTNSFPATMAGAYTIQAMRAGANGPESRGQLVVNVPPSMPARILTAVASASGTVTEASFNSGKGGTVDPANLMVGDTSGNFAKSTGNLQQKAFLTFNMPSLPAGAQVKYGVIRMRLQQTSSKSPYDSGWNGRLFADLGVGNTLWPAGPLVASSFASQPAGPRYVARAVEMSRVDDVNAWTEGVLTPAAIQAFTQASGPTPLQFRLYFESPTNRNDVAEFLAYVNSSSQPNHAPQLILYYTTAAGTHGRRRRRTSERRTGKTGYPKQHSGGRKGE